MAVKEIDIIEIPGYTQYSLYSFEYSPGFASGYGTITAEFLNKSGQYSDINLNNVVFVPILINVQNDGVNPLGTYIPIEYEKSADNKAKTLRVVFADKSINLDRFFVATRGEVGYDNIALAEMTEVERSRIVYNKNNHPRLIWVGKSDKNCSEQIFDELLSMDPCDPCNNDTNILNCNEYYLFHKRVYKYTFQELIQALNSSSIGLNFTVGEASRFDNLKFNYSGSAREVLNNVCSEIGLTFFYNPLNEAIEFVDTKTGIEVNLKNLKALENKCKVLSEKIVKSKASSVDVFGSAVFSKEGEEKSYSCDGESCRKLSMMPITLSDLFSSGLYFSNDEILGSLDNPLKRLEFFSVLTGQVGFEFRNAVLWGTKSGYNFKTAKDVEDNGQDKKLHALGGMEIKKVFYFDSQSAINASIYHILLSLYSSQIEDNLEELVKNYKTYFFLAKVNRQDTERVAKFEADLCGSFYGQYWIRRFKQHWKNLNYSVLSPDGTVQYYDYRDPINLPFANILYDGLGSFDSSPLLNPPPNGLGDGIADGESPNTLKARDTFFLMTRPASFSPISVDNDKLKEIEKFINNYSFRELDIPLDLHEQLSLLPDLADYDKDVYKLFVVHKEFETDTLTVKTPKIVNHVEELPNVVVQVNACDKYTSYGLSDAQARQFSLSGDGFTLDITMPVQSFIIGENDQEDAHSGYTVLLQRSGDSNSFVIPKTEIFSDTSIPDISNAGLSIKYNPYNASESDLALLSRTMGKPYCDLNFNAIQDLLSSVASLLNYSEGLEERQEFRLEGIPVDFYTVADGLKQFSILCGESGLTTSISFSNTFPFRLSAETFFNKLKYNTLQRILGSFPSAKEKKLLGNEIREVDYD